MHFIYSAIYLVAMLVLLPFEYKKRPKELRGRWIREKFGLFDFDNSKSNKVVWLHAVSVGESLAAVPLIKDFKEKHRDISFVISTITDTGQKVAAERLTGIAKVIYMPFDLGFVLKRAIARFRPSLFVSMETEIWPGAFRAMKKAEVKVAIINGRISERSFSGYKKIRFFLKRVLENVDAFCMQDAVYAGRAIDVGASPERVIVTGNMKFDIRPPQARLSWADSIAGQVIVAGSTHRGEEELILNAYLRLKAELPSLNLILAPRHPERFDEVANLLRGVAFVRRSEISDRVSGSVILLDKIGELLGAYSLADIAVIGGSFIEHGGQNPLEAAYWSKPIVCGPHMENFPFTEEFFKDGGAIRVSEEGLYGTLKELLENPDKRISVGQKAKALSMKNTGAVERTIFALERLI